MVAAPGGWAEVADDVNRALPPNTPSLVEKDAFLLYLMILLLYEEGVEPSKAEIMFKLKEHNASDTLLEHAMTYYAATAQWYRVTRSAEDGAVESVYLKVLPSWFQGWVDLKSPSNSCSPLIWVEFLEFLLDVTFSGYKGAGLFCHTRYALAKVLKKEGPLVIQHLRLGDVAHLIQLALQQEFLCYEATTIVPSWTSLEFLREKEFRLVLPEGDELTAIYDCLDHNVSSKIIRSGQTSTASFFRNFDIRCEQWFTKTDSRVNKVISRLHRLEHLGACLRNLLADNDRILLSQVRVMLMSRYGLDLKPSRMGYTKLSDLLHDQFSDICRLVRHRNRHVYIEAGESTVLGDRKSVCILGAELYVKAWDAVNAKANLASGENLRTAPESYQFRLRCLEKNEIKDWTADDLRVVEQTLCEHVTPFFALTKNFK